MNINIDPNYPYNFFEIWLISKKLIVIWYLFVNWNVNWKKDKIDVDFNILFDCNLIKKSDMETIINSLLEDKIIIKINTENKYFRYELSINANLTKLYIDKYLEFWFQNKMKINNFNILKSELQLTIIIEHIFKLLESHPPEYLNIPAIRENEIDFFALILFLEQKDYLTICKFWEAAEYKKYRFEVCIKVENLEKDYEKDWKIKINRSDKEIRISENIINNGTNKINNDSEYKEEWVINMWKFIIKWDDIKTCSIWYWDLIIKIDWKKLRRQDKIILYKLIKINKDVPLNTVQIEDILEECGLKPSSSSVYWSMSRLRKFLWCINKSIIDWERTTWYWIK